MSSHNPLTRGKKQKVRTLLAEHRLAEAGPLLEQICRLDRRDAEAWYLLGAIYQQSERFDEAAACYRHTLSLQPGNADVHYHLGNVLSALHRRDEAAGHYRRAIALHPGYIEAHCNLGGLYEQENRLEEALACYQQALRLAPERAELHYNAGCAARRLEQLDAAEQHYRDAIRLQPGLAAAYNNLANVLQQRSRMDDAIACYRRAVEINPAYTEAFYNLGMALRDIGQVSDAIACYRRAIELKSDHADAHFGLSTLLLLTGNFREGWREYEWHWHRADSPARPLPVSAREPSDLRERDVFLHAEQGLGDELFFLRFLPWLKAAGARTVTYRPTSKTASLLAHCPGIDRLVAALESPAAEQLVLAVGDLPRVLGIERSDQTPTPLRLVPRTELTAALQARLQQCGPPPYVGITWRAGTQDNTNRLYKESPLSSLAISLNALPATVVVIQRQPRQDEMTALVQQLGRPAHDFSALNEDLEQMLALLSLLDDYIGVSNTNMHLRAAAGRTARVLVPMPPEWRWMAEGNESPWFPGFTVYRQGHDGNWGKAFDMLAADLQPSFRR